MFLDLFAQNAVQKGHKEASGYVYPLSPLPPPPPPLLLLSSFLPLPFVLPAPRSNRLVLPLPPPLLPFYPTAPRSNRLVFLHPPTHPPTYLPGKKDRG